MNSIKYLFPLLFLFSALTTVAQAPVKLTVHVNGLVNGKIYFEMFTTSKPVIDSLVLTNGRGVKEFPIQQPTTLKLYDHYSSMMIDQLGVKNISKVPVPKAKVEIVKDESHELFRKALLGMKFMAPEDHFELIVRPGEEVEFTARKGKFGTASVKGRNDVVGYSQLEQQLESIKVKIADLEKEITQFSGPVDDAVYAKYDDQLTTFVRYIYNRYHSKGLEIVSFSVDDKLEAWKKAVEEDGLAWPQVSDLKGIKAGVAKDFGISGVPTNFLVKDGKIIGVFLRWQLLNALIQENLGK